MCREDKQFDPFAETPVDGVIAAQVNSHILFSSRASFFRRLFVGFPFSFPWAFCLLSVGCRRFSVSFPLSFHLSAFLSAFHLSAFLFVFGVSSPALMICILHSNLGAGGDLDLHFFPPLHKHKRDLSLKCFFWLLEENERIYNVYNVLTKICSVSFRFSPLCIFSIKAESNIC
jgi:hypothetical protein